MTKKQILIAACMTFFLPQMTLAYVSPEEVLLNKDMYMPPEARRAGERTELQAAEAAARRDREQEAAFALQHPEPFAEASSSSSETMYGAAPSGWPAGFVAVPIQVGGSTIPMMQMMGSTTTQSNLDVNANLELLRTMRLVSRVNQNQTIGDGGDVLHAAARPLAGSGPGAVLSAMTMAGSVLWTLRRAGKAPKATL